METSYPKLIRNAAPADAAALLAIYAPYITDTCVSFETEAPTVEEFAMRIAGIIKDYPYLVCEIGGQIVGYAYASRHRERAAYLYSADVSVYVAPEHHRRGVGRALYTRLFALLKEQGIRMTFAGVTLPNEGSVGLHRAFGFRSVGVYHNVGYKLGQWLDVLWLEKQIGDCGAREK